MVGITAQSQSFDQKGNLFKGQILQFSIIWNAYLSGHPGGGVHWFGSEF